MIKAKPQVPATATRMTDILSSIQQLNRLKLLTVTTAARREEVHICSAT
jgi:hypothetical protein